MKKVILIIGTIFLLSGCASEGVVEKSSMIKKSSASDSLINFVVIQEPGEGDIGYLLAPTALAGILVDGKRIALLKKKEITQTNVSEGKHKITVYWKGQGLWNKKHVTLDFQSDKTYYFGIGVAEVKGFQYGDKASLVTLDKEKWESYTSQ